jgi:hypothetical protein
VRRLLSALAAASLILAAQPASADESYVCWSDQVLDGVRDDYVTITRCRIGGSEIRDYASDADVPARLYVDVGTDLLGSCWFYRTGQTDWVLITLYADGSALLGYNPAGAPGGPVAVDTVEPRCTSEPVDVPTAFEEAWQLLATYTHPIPDPLIDPRPGWGLAGLETFVGLTPPDPWSASLFSPVTGRFLEVETWVDAVEVRWGDGEVATFPRDLFPLLTGYPNGVGAHSYQVMTCDPPGSDRRCAPDLTAYPLAVDYVWSARYRVDGGAWLPIPVPRTGAAVDYPVAEIIGLVTAGD